MKKVFHFVSTKYLGGLENMVINISTLVNGYDYTYVSPDGPINNYLNKCGIKHISIKKMTPFYVNKILRNYNPDIVHGHDVKASISLAVNYFIIHKKNIRIISELHNDDPRMQKLTLRSILYQLSTPFYRKIIVVSKPVIDNYLFRSKIKNKTVIIDNVINPLRIKKCIGSVAKNNIKWNYAFVGRLVNQKNPLAFIEIIYNLKKYNNNVSAIIIGRGPLQERMIKLINEYHLSKNIYLAGFQSNPYKYLKNTKILIMPSLFEGFGLVALESLIVGVPVIASPVGGLKNIINDSCGYFAYDKNDFVEKSLLLNKDDIYNNKKRKTITRAREVNNVTKFIKLYQSIYKD